MKINEPLIMSYIWLYSLNRKKNEEMKFGQLGNNDSLVKVIIDEMQARECWS